MLTHTPSAKELEVFLPLMSLRSCSERDSTNRFQLKIRKCTRMAEGACWIQLCIPAMHDTFLRGLIVPASYDEYTALVKSDGASKHVWKAVKGAYCWWQPGYRDLLSYVTFLLDMWPVLCWFFLRHAWTGVVAQASWYFRTVLWSIRCPVSLSRLQSSACCAVHVAWVCFQ